MVRGLPSDHCRPERRVTLTVNVLPSGAMTTSPLAWVGIEAARSGMYFPSWVMFTRPRSAGEIASTVVNAVEKNGFRLSGGCHSPMTRVPPGVAPVVAWNFVAKRAVSSADCVAAGEAPSLDAG